MSSERWAVGSGQWAEGALTRNRGDLHKTNSKLEAACVCYFLPTAHCPLPTAHCPLFFLACEFVCLLEPNQEFAIDLRGSFKFDFKVPAVGGDLFTFRDPLARDI